jgi:hypothetical protein
MNEEGGGLNPILALFPDPSIMGGSSCPLERFCTIIDRYGAKCKVMICLKVA